MINKIRDFWFQPADAIRLDTFRCAFGIFLFGYMAHRWQYAKEWLTTSGFHPSPASLPYHPVSVPLLPEEVLPFFGAALFAAILAFTFGIMLRTTTWILLTGILYVTLADQYAAYTLNKLSVVCLLLFACCQHGYYWRVTDKKGPSQISIWPVRILQATFIIQYFNAGWNKAFLGDWLNNGYVLFSQMQGYYRSDIAAWMFNHLPLKAWPLMQLIALLFELLVPLLFMCKRLRPIGYIWGSIFQLMIALCMHNLIYFMLIMWCFFIVFIDETNLHKFRQFVISSKKRLLGRLKIKHGPILILTILTAFFFTGCDQLYRLLHKEGAEEKEIVGESLPLEKNPNIEEVQRLLEIYGYDPGPIDGILGRRTRDAIERFQEDNHLDPSRFVDQQTWQKLRIFKAEGFITDGELNIRAVQTALKTAGFDPGPVDGKMGPKTVAAIKAFQKAHQLKVDAKVGYKTLSALSVYEKEGQ